MIADRHYSVSAIEAARNLADFQNRHREVALTDAIAVLRAGPSHQALLDYDKGNELLEVLGAAALAAEDPVLMYRDVLLRMIMDSRPAWAAGSVWGRSHAISTASAECQQVLQYAGLVPPNEAYEVVEWWDAVARLFRSSSEAALLSVGREAERMAFEREVAIAANSGRPRPHWIALDDNRAGFDILAWRSGSAPLREMLIEVKGFRSVPRFYLSRHEWRTACRNPLAYEIQVWNVASRTAVVLDLERISSHIPVDVGSGEWQTIEITLSDWLPSIYSTEV